MKRLFVESFLREIRPLFMIEIDLFAYYARVASVRYRANTVRELAMTARWR
jgi:hypothetical protein